MPTEHGLFGELRSIFAHPPSPETFSSLCHAIEERAEVVSERVDLYVEDHLNRWDPTLPRRAPQGWVIDVMEGRDERPLHWCNSIHLTAYYVDELGADRLARHEVMGRVIEVEMEANSLKDRATSLFIEGTNAPELSRLALLDNLISPHGVCAIARASSLPSLTSLELGLNTCGLLGARDLATSPLGQRLVDLSLHYNRIGDEGVSWIFSEMKALRHLVVSECDLQIESVRSLVTRTAPLHGLVLSSNFIADDGIEFLTQARALFEVEHLGLAAVGLGTRGCEALAQSRVLSHVIDLDISSNYIGDEGVIALIRSPHLRRLKRLDLRRNNLTDRAGRMLCDAIGRWPEFEEIVIDESARFSRVTKEVLAPLLS